MYLSNKLSRKQLHDVTVTRKQLQRNDVTLSVQVLLHTCSLYSYAYLFSLTLIVLIFVILIIWNDDNFNACICRNLGICRNLQYHYPLLWLLSNVCEMFFRYPFHAFCTSIGGMFRRKMDSIFVVSVEVWFSYIHHVTKRLIPQWNVEYIIYYYWVAALLFFKLTTIWQVGAV